ncbi:MAG: class I lanthipeptide [Candidatus Aminicenantes bacterium]|nr:MAG: class I lanthipeptide [Candidatus Aminicenantes bacterium]
MKPRNFEKKLVLSKKTIANLNDDVKPHFKNETEGCKPTTDSEDICCA